MLKYVDVRKQHWLLSVHYSTVMSAAPKRSVSHALCTVISLVCVCVRIYLYCAVVVLYMQTVRRTVLWTPVAAGDQHK